MDRHPNDNYSHSDHPSAAQYSQPHHQEIRAAPPNNYASSGPPNPDYPSATPSSARSSTFPQEYLSRQHYTPGTASMAQAQNSSIAAASPTTHYPPYSPHGYPQNHDMGQHNQHYAPSYPPWPGYPPHMAYNSPPSASSPSTTGPPRPGQQVYSFVPIPGSNQQKRPRRRYEEIERMYKCGHGSCEKAYGTLNHLNAHVTMQGHGVKRTPEEFKEIRKEWKQRKKEADAKEKEANGGRDRVDSGPEAQLAGATSSPDSSNTPTSQTYPRQLPPLAYPNGNNAYSQDQMYQNGQPQVYSTYPHPPYNSSSQVYPRQ